MSVLSFPRLYFKGNIGWDPCTFNNNDFQAFQTYDATNAALNWSFLKTLTPPITQDNFKTTFRPWSIKLQGDDIDDPKGPRVPAEWNMFGSHNVNFVQYNQYQSLVTGGALSTTNQAAAGDPVLGAPVTLMGDSATSGAKLVDTNPSSFWSSQIYHKFFKVGNEADNCAVSGPCVTRMHSRWVNMGRIYDATAQLTQPAAKFAACFQTCLPNDTLRWINGSATPTSPTLAALQQASAQKGAQGLMVRFTAYVNVYFQNGIYNGIAQQPRNYTDLAGCLADAWAAWNNDGDPTKFFSQPCYSHVVGSVGVWNSGELTNVPLGRYLLPVAQVTPTGGTNTTWLGPVVAQVDAAATTLSLDLGSAIPELGDGTGGSDLTKVNLGTLSIGLQEGVTIQPIASLDYGDYAKAAYEATAGIVDVPVPQGMTAQQLQQGTLVLQTGSGTSPVTALSEQAYSAQTDTRGIYLDQSGQQQFQITVLNKGLPAPGAKVMLAQYNGNLSLVPTAGPSYVGFTLGDLQELTVGGVSTKVTVVTADANGIATAGVSAQASGFPVIGFYPFAGSALPAPLPSFFGPNVAGPGAYFYTTVRVLPFDNAVPQQFIDLWNSTGDEQKAWDFVYNNILYVYDMIFCVMLKHVDLGNKTIVEQNATYLRQKVLKEVAAESTTAMPVTRDLSEGKRTALLLWCYLAERGYPKQPIDLDVLSDGEEAPLA